MSKRLFVTSLSLLMTFACSMEGASVIYSYTGRQGDALPVLSFQFTVPSLLTPTVGYPPYNSPQVPVASMTSYTFPTANFLGINLFTLPGTPGTLPPPSDGISFDQPNQLNFVYFPFGTLGTYGVTSQAFFGSGTLIIAPIPEPSSLLLLTSGCLGLLVAARRKLPI